VPCRYTIFLTKNLGGKSTILFASCGIPISQENLSGRKRDREFESFFLSGESSKLGVALTPVATSKDAALTGAASRRGLETVRKHWAVRGAVATASRSDLVIR